MQRDAVALLPVPALACDSPAAVDVMDETAFHAFYQRTARPLWSYIRRITGDGTVADDVVQTAFCRDAVWMGTFHPGMKTMRSRPETFRAAAGGSGGPGGGGSAA